ncbi:MAG TPA: ATP-binding protein [Polyangiales bacterium]|jgi:hypothetical protein
MSIANVIRGKQRTPIRVLIYGQEGIGKSTFAAGAPNPVFICGEDGTSELDVARYPRPDTFAEVREAVQDLTASEHDYKTLVIDTVDAIEPLLWRAVYSTMIDKKGRPLTSIEDVPYGRGFPMAVETKWIPFAKELELLEETRGMNVVLLAHSQIRKFKNPDGEDYDRYEMALQQGAAGFLRGWCKAVLFASYETLTHEVNGRAKGISTGARFLYTQRKAAADAKNRYDLPPALPLEWEAFERAVRLANPDPPELIRARIDQLLPEATDELRAQVRDTLAKVAPTDAAQLARIEDRLAAKVSLLNKQRETTT